MKLSLFANDIILHIENPIDDASKPLEIINEFYKVSGYKINKQKSVAFLYSNNERSECKMKEIVSFIFSWKSIKYLEINLPKEAKDMYSENFKMLMKKSRMTQTDGKIYHILGLEKSILSKWIYYWRQSIDSMWSLLNYQWHFSQN